MNIHNGWAVYSYKSKNKVQVNFTPDAIFNNENEADWYGAFSRPCGFHFPVKYVLIDDRAFILSETGLPVLNKENIYGQKAS